MAHVTVECYFCHTLFEKSVSEFNRATRRNKRHFCSCTCAVKQGNLDHQRKATEVVKQCPHCGAEFPSTTKAKAATYCSRSCASSASVTERRRTGNRQGGVSAYGMLSPEERTQLIAAGLRSREGWKYERIIAQLDLLGVAVDTEYPLHPYVYDVALPNLRLLVEYDGDYHATPVQTETDKAKTEHAIQCGWQLLRLPEIGRVLDPAQLVEELRMRGHLP